MLAVRSEINTEPSVEPVSVTEVREHLRLDTTDDDSYLASLIEAARKTVEEAILWKALITQTWDDYFDNFDDELELRWSPVQSISSITYVDGDGTTQTVDTSIYELGKLYGHGVAREQYNQTWPTDCRGHNDDVKVTYVAGYGDSASDVPQQIRIGILHLIAHWYRTREPVTLLVGGNVQLIPKTVRLLLAPYQSQRVMV